MKIRICGLILAVAFAAPVLALGHAARNAQHNLVVQGGHPTGPGDGGGGVAFQGGHPTGPGDGDGGGAAFQGGHPTGPGDGDGGGVTV